MEQIDRVRGAETIAQSSTVRPVCHTTVMDKGNEYKSIKSETNDQVSNVTFCKGFSIKEVQLCFISLFITMLYNYHLVLSNSFG